MEPTSFSLASLAMLGIVLGVFFSLAGFAAGWWFFGGKTKTALADAINVDRALMAAGQIQDLANRILFDVGSHNVEVEKISDELKSLTQRDTGPVSDCIVTAVSKIFEANERLQSRLVRAEEKLKEQADEIASHQTAARTDVLTNLPNRRAFDDEMSRRFAEWQRMGTQFSLMIFDIDHFKKFNDTHGHLAGDEVLRRVGAAMAEVTREMDLPCRYGGEEFTVVMPATASKDAKRAVERARKTIEAMAVPFEGKELKVTTSVGLAEVLPHDDCGTLIRRSDEALYASKEAGRNCGHFHDGETCLPITPGITPNPNTIRRQAKPETEFLSVLPDKKTFCDALQRRVAESHRYGLPLSVLVAQLQKLDKIVADHGPDAGSVALNRAAQSISESLREMDLLARASEEQFAVMLPGSTEAEAKQIARRMSSRLDEVHQKVEGEEIPMAVDIGCASFEDHDDSDQLINDAIKALESKREGTTELEEAAAAPT